MGDRSGSRESKGTSLKTSKKNPGGVAARGQKKVKATVILNISEQPTEIKFLSNNYIDSGCAILSRQFDRDQDRVFQRASTEGQCCFFIIWFSDINKQGRKGGSSIL